MTSTLGDGSRVKKHALRDGDVIGIGKHELKYVNEHATADDDEFEKTMIIKPGSASAAVAAARYHGADAVYVAFFNRPAATTSALAALATRRPAAA